MADLIGETVGPYQITERLGRGGMADVYKAFHKDLEVYRAIKFIRPELGESEDFRTRFLKEAQGVARLQHPNIVGIYDFGATGDRYYMVMEMVEGRSLKQILKSEGGLSIDRSVALVKAVAGALAYAHDQGLIHRDIKPDNIMVDQRGRPVLMDVGIAKLITGDAKITQTGHLIGTPAYMAPEQSKALDVGPPTDIYALSVVLFELLTGHTPFEADTPMAVVLKSLSDPIPMPRSFNANISEELQGVILKGTAKDMGERYQSALEFIAALDRAMDKIRPTMEPTVVLPAPASNVTAGSSALTFVVVALLFVVLGGGLAWWILGRDAGAADGVPAVAGSEATGAETPVATIPPVAITTPGIGAESPAPAGSPPAELPAPVQPPPPMDPAVTISPQPADAQVRIEGVEQPYAPGMRLAPGTYQVTVEKPGYIAWRGPIEVTDRDFVQAVQLAPQAPVEKVTQSPGADSQAQAPATAQQRLADTARAEEAQRVAAEQAQETRRQEQARKEEAAVKDVKNLLARALPEMVPIPAGRFMMGCPAADTACLPAEQPAHEVHVGAFRLSRYEITFDQYDAFATATRRTRPDDKGWGRGNRPVINVNWEDAQAFVAWLSQLGGKRFRLPTEAEWEYAARGGVQTTYVWGNEIGLGQANCTGCGSNWDGDRTSPAGSFAANAFGLHDVHGNVWEWVQDCWQDGYAGAPSDGSARNIGNCATRVLRGGSWLNNPSYLRLAYRNWLASTLRDVNTGFRVAQD